MQIRALTFVGGLVVAFAASACAQPEATESTPDVLESVDAQDVGTSYNGWSQSVGAWADYCNIDTPSMAHTLSRSSGDNTRGGGACHVNYAGGYCTDDSPCVSGAQSMYGGQAWGYCYSNTCYYRAGAQTDWCVLNPNRSAGTLALYGMTSNQVVGCMTKTAGPNTACGGTNTSLYMRTLVNTTFYQGPQCW